MAPTINLRQMQKAMNRLGIKQQEIEAKEVIIKTSGNDILIRNPQVIKVNMMGQETFQITGNIEEVSGISDEDVKTVAEQANVSEERARKALEKTEGDLAKAIMELTGSS